MGLVLGLSLGFWVGANWGASEWANAALHQRAFDEAVKAQKAREARELAVMRGEGPGLVVWPGWPNVKGQ